MLSVALLFEMRILLCVLIFFGASWAESLSRKFPSDFVFGVSTSAYQIEGAWNESGKGESLLDFLTHEFPSLIADGSNGDVACDSYHKLDDDIAMLKELGVNFYRFSISWTRILPTGKINNGFNSVSSHGVKYYLDLLEKLEAAGIDAMVTLFHFDLPMELLKEGIFIKENLDYVFEEYARLAFGLFGSKVKYWITFNEPVGQCSKGMEFLSLDPGRASYTTAHHIIKSHAAVYHLYKNAFKEKYGGQISIALNIFWYEPASKLETDIEAAQRALIFDFGWFAHPLIYGEYPTIMRQRIAENTASYLPSRLPEFTDEEKQFVKGTIDFIALNHYSTKLVADNPNTDFYRTVSKDVGVSLSVDPNWEATILDWLYVVPSGMRKILKWIDITYNKIPIMITENGYADDGTLDDYKRISYLQKYLDNILYAIYDDGVNVIGYSSWSLMDNWELTDGYNAKFGLYNVNFTSPNRDRTAKKSVDFYKKLVRTKCLVDNCS